MNIEKITPQIAALYMGRMCTYQSRALEGVLETPINARVLSDLEDGFATVTPHLRRMNSITEEEAREIYKLFCGNDWMPFFPEKPGAPECVTMWAFSDIEVEMPGIQLAYGNPAVWLKLLEWGFDLFGLIDSKLAK